MNMLKVGVRGLSKQNSSLILSTLVEDLIPIVEQQTPNGTLRFFCPGRKPNQRVGRLLSEEPETICWIDSFDDGKVFWDIGANIGLYSLYAGLHPKMKVLSFEPASTNYFVLNKNIEINALDDRLQSFCIAFSDQSKLSYFYMSDTVFGGALNSFNKEVDWRGNPYQAAFRQAMIGYSIDEFIEKFDPLFPNYLKIDVDGIESEIIAGAIETLSDPRLESLLIEHDETRQDHLDAIEHIQNCGLRLVEITHSEMVANSDFAHIFNHIFLRSA